MIPPILSLLAFLSTILFPWPLTVVLALGAAFFEPLVPLAVGIFADTLYAPSLVAVPHFTLLGAVASVVALFVRSRLRAGSMR